MRAAVTLLTKTSSGEHFVFVRHYARSCLARDDLHSSRIRSTSVKRNAQPVLSQTRFFSGGKFVQSFPLGNYNGFNIDERSNIGKRSPKSFRPLGNQNVPNGVSGFWLLTRSKSSPITCSSKPSKVPMSFPSQKSQSVDQKKSFSVMDFFHHSKPEKQVPPNNLPKGTSGSTSAI